MFNIFFFLVSSLRRNCGYPTHQLLWGYFTRRARCHRYTMNKKIKPFSWFYKNAYSFFYMLYIAYVTRILKIRLQNCVTEVIPGCWKMWLSIQSTHPHSHSRETLKKNIQRQRQSEMGTWAATWRVVEFQLIRVKC